MNKKENKSVKIDRVTYDTFKELKEATGIPISEIIRRSLKLFIKKIK